VHLALLVSVPLFLVAAVWQVHRAESGNLLSYGYAVEWPLFAGIAVYLWWQLIHTDPEARAAARAARLALADRDEEDTETPAPRREDESPELRRYNDELEVLAHRGRRKSWRNPRGLP
jgi:hypothetical protein